MKMWNEETRIAWYLESHVDVVHTRRLATGDSGLVSISLAWDMLCNINIFYRYHITIKVLQWVMAYTKISFEART